MAIIATPTIIYVKKAAARQQEIDASFSDFFKTATTSFIFHEGEKFSGKLFENWNPTEEEQKILFENWSTKIKHLPIEFFSLFLSIKNEKPQPTKEFKDICYLKINYSTGLKDREIQLISTPFLKTQLPIQQQPTITSLSMFKDNSIFVKKHQSNAQLLKSEEQTQSPYKENIEFFNKIYDTTKKHLNQLGYYPDTIVPLWSYDSLHCSAVAATAIK